MKEEQLDEHIDGWEKAWKKHGSKFQADAHEEEEEEGTGAPPETTARPEGLGKGPGLNGDGGDGGGNPPAGAACGPPVLVGPVG